MDYRGYYIHRIIYYIYIVYVEALYWKVEIILALKFRGYIAYYQFRREVKFLTRPGSNVRRRNEGSLCRRRAADTGGERCERCERTGAMAAAGKCVIRYPRILEALNWLIYRQLAAIRPLRSS